jgi:tetratricopeptide (TPR) repeat protein
MSDRDKIAAECFRKGTEAMQKENWDYAIDMFTKSVMLVRDNLLFRQTRHGCIRKKYDENGSGAKMSKMKLMGTKNKIKKAKSKSDWETVDKLTEEGLVINPWDDGLLIDLGNAAEESGWNPIAKYAYETAVKAAPTNIENLRRLAQLSRDQGEYGTARACFSQIYKLDPEDSEARQAMGQLDAENMLDRGGLEAAENTKDVKKEEVNAYEADRRARKASMEQAVDGPGQSEEADMQRAVRKEPENVNTYLKLADFYRNKKRHQEAYDTYAKAIEACGDDANVREQMEDVELELLRLKRTDIKDQFRKRPDSGDLKDQVGKIAKKLVKREIEVLGTRIDRYPNDLRLKFELAQRFKQVGKTGKAIPLFQQATADTRIKEDVLVALGESFIKEKKLDLARRQFEKALETINSQDKPDVFKNASYWVGRLYEKAGKTDQAEHHYLEILAVDYEYKDVKDRLETLQGGDGEGEGLDD